MKFILPLLMAFAIGAQAQFRTIPLIEGGTNNITLNATNTYSAIVDVSRQAEVAIQVHGGLISSNLMNLRLDFMRTVDGSTWASTNFVSVVAQGGTNDLSGGVVCITTNVSVPGIRSLKLFRVANLDTIAIVTNLTVSYGVKRY